ncbi:peptidoglycan DD-metalloendopeptidase family protein [Octadecabacter sp.]|nr:peptidoglycan DD-metalloendopeptidase family protein [Octadecabacter sp.]
MRLAIVMTSCAMPAMAQDFSLAQPIDCTLGETCYIQNYVDTDPTEHAIDFQCGSLTYDTHKGTDFGLPSLAAMDAGVNVLVAADGVVRGTRNDMRDVIYSDQLATEINGRDCGNGVVIAHGGGWETQYCHLKEGSVVVRNGDAVTVGDTVGLVGLSGRTQFPHLHISVRRDGQTIDPFDPAATGTCNTPPSETLWAEPIPTPQGGLLASGFSLGIPEYSSVKAGTAGHEQLSANAPIVLWGFAYGTRPGDVVKISYSGPDGPLFETSDVLDRTQALTMRAGGLNPPHAGWESGTYRGIIEHTRDDVVLGRQTSIAIVP